MSTMRLGLDIDGVLANYNHGFRTVLAEVTGRKNDVPELEEPTEWHWPAALGYTPAEVEQAQARLEADAFFWASLPAYPGVFSFLDWLWRAVSEANWTQGASHEVYFLTARLGHRAKDQSENWLHRHGYKGKHPTVLMANDGKGRLAADLQLTHLLDDRTDNVHHVRLYHPGCQTYLLDRAWNRAEQAACLAAGAAVVPTLKDFQTILSSEF